MPANIPSEAEVLTYFDKLSNWGRWGGGDQLGTLNLLSRRQDPPSNRACARRRNRVLIGHRLLDA